MNKSSKNDENEEEKEIVQPSASSHAPPFIVGRQKSKLIHPRKELWKWLFSYINPFRRKFFLLFALLLIGTLISSITPLIAKNIIDNGIDAKDGLYIISMSTFYFSLLIIMAIVTYYSHFGMGVISQKITFKIRNDLFFKLQDMSLSYFDLRPSGDIISITTNDVTILNQLVGGQFVIIITSIVNLGLTLVIMYILNVYLALISMIVFPIFFIITYLFRKVAMSLFKESRKTIGSVTSSIQDNIAGARVVQAYGQEQRASSEFDRANTANYNAMLKVRKFMGTIFPLINLSTSILTAGVLLAGGIVALGNITILGISITAGVLVAYISILGQFFRPFMMLMQIQEITASALAASDRIYTLLQEKVEILDIDNPKIIENVKGKIEFDSVSFGYIIDENGLINLGTKPQTMKQITLNSKIGFESSILKEVMDIVRLFPEPYSSYIMKNAMYFPQILREKLFLNLIGKKSEEIPKIIDQTLAEFGFAIPDSENAKRNPNLKTSFNMSKENLTEDILPNIPSQAILQMSKLLEKNLRSKNPFQQSSSNGLQSEGSGIMGGDLNQMSLKEIVKILAKIKIPKDVYDQIPKIVSDVLDEQKKILKHEQSTGYVLKNVDLDFPIGKTTAIVGETGAGKTTIVKLISRFYDINNGEIRLDGVNIREISKVQLRNLIGLVPQDAFLFSGSIRENLLYAFDEITPEIEKKMYEVSKFLGLHNFIEALYEKYDTKLKENAANISIGQRQLIAFARALITDPKILILDEATSSVDPYTETLIQDALDKARTGRTTIIIAHRLSTIKNADKIIVLSADKKGVIEQGTHDSLIKLDGKYKRLLDMQRRDIEAHN